MKKTLRFIVILLAVLIAGVLILAVAEPRDVTVTRSVIINAPKEAVFEQMVRFRNWPNWSPWFGLDTAMTITYSGTDGTPGSSYKWESKSKNVGAGSMTDKAVTGTQMDFHIDFEKPFKNTADGMLKAEDTGEATRATWTFNTHCPFPFNAMLAFVDMGKKVGGDFELGLNKMKSYVESHTTHIEIKETNYPARTIEGIRKTVSWNDIMKFCGDTYGALKKDEDVVPKISGVALGIYYTWDTVNRATDMVAGFPVSDTAELLKGASFTHIGPSKAFLSVLRGGYANEMQAHAALLKRVRVSKKQQLCVVEEYLVGPLTEPDTAKWVTNIYYLVQ